MPLAVGLLCFGSEPIEYAVNNLMVLGNPAQGTFFSQYACNLLQVFFEYLRAFLSAFETKAANRKTNYLSTQFNQMELL